MESQKEDPATTSPTSGGEIQITDPITAGEARAMLGISKEKMSRLLKNKLAWKPGDLDERTKLVSRSAVEKILKEGPPRHAKNQQERADKDTRMGSRIKEQQQIQKTQEPNEEKSIFLAEWMAYRNIDSREIARRSQQKAAQHIGPTTQLANRETLLKAKAVSLPTIRRIARKQQHPLSVTIERLAEALGITAEQLGQLPPTQGEEKE